MPANFFCCYRKKNNDSENSSQTDYPNFSNNDSTPKIKFIKLHLPHKKDLYINISNYIAYKNINDNTIKDSSIIFIIFYKNVQYYYSGIIDKALKSHIKLEHLNSIYAYNIPEEYENNILRWCIKIRISESMFYYSGIEFHGSIEQTLNDRPCHISMALDTIIDLPQEESLSKINTKVEGVSIQTFSLQENTVH
ncbi:hypothetical protein [Candidatus Neoehrlichia procyonis]|uniref:Uncharacterized protein n=1 Tax=Candidatus Neoehrlichia procyonis str. RAC413 TaxID=1359163 RepID=A0A0F3NP82_9RICK|nr:hypothetical protein [Candidatus Neoehrlichia lotoris]KJV68709.1 hypothetical protein NLO413_0070 [Candidatus Neoehrlichia lotoris str. RAC413]